MLIRVSYKRATFLVCAGNVVVMLCMMYLILSPLYLKSSPQVMAVAPSYGRYSQTNSKEEVERLESSYQLRRGLIPTQLIQEVKELQAETEGEVIRTKRLSAVRQKVAIEVSHRLAEVKQSNTQSNHQGLSKWKKKKLQSAKRHEVDQHRSAVSRWKVLSGMNK